MRTEQEIREELARLEQERKKDLAGVVLAALNIRKWALKWVLGEEE